jgi:DNA repair exonuclease SbcCD nuclease subunit
MADCHIGGWRDPKMQELSMLAFQKSIEIALDENVDFVLIAGDLFNTSIPGVEKIKSVVIELKKLKNASIPVYLIPGSHDFSPSGKTMLDVLEEAGLFINVCRGKIENGKLRLDFTTDRSGAKITGILGKKGMLDQKYYEELDREHLENENGFKIFMFHTSLTELKPKKLEKMESYGVSLLPKNFDYYAGGHVHIIAKSDFEERKNIVYPGPVFPNSFSELAELKNGGVYLYEDGVSRYVPIIVKKIASIELNGDHKSAQELHKQLRCDAENLDAEDKIVLIRLSGTLEQGKPADINMKEIFEILYEKKSYSVLKNSNKLHSKEFESVKVNHDSVQDIESSIIQEEWGHLNTLDKSEEVNMINRLMQILQSEKKEGETKTDYENRVIEQTEVSINEIIDH